MWWAAMSSLYRPETEIVRKRLLAARHAAGLTQQAVAQAWGMPQETISAIERGARRIDVVELMDLCKILGLDVVELIGSVRDEVGTTQRGTTKPIQREGKPRHRRA